MPEAKEPHYFAQNLSNRYCRVRDLDAYFSLFDQANEGQVCGEASVLYGFFPSSIRAILEFNPNAKFIFMLRHPIDMIISYHGQLLVNLEEDQKDFERAWALQTARLGGDIIPPLSKDPSLLQYAQIGALGGHLNTIKALVPTNQFLTLLIDGVSQNPENEYQKVLDFLSVEKNHTIDFARENEASAVRYIWLQKIIFSHNWLLCLLKSIAKKMLSKNMRQSLNRTKRKKNNLNAGLHTELLDCFDTDIKILEQHFQAQLKSSYKKV